MEKVICRICGRSGYTASPDYVFCECGCSVERVDKEKTNILFVRRFFQRKGMRYECLINIE